MHSDPDSALIFLQHGIDIEKLKPRSLYLWKFYVVQGLVFKHLVENEKVLERYELALDNLPPKDSLDAWLMIRANQASLYQEAYKDLDRALEIYMDCLEKNDTSSADLRRTYLMNLNNVGLIYKNQKKYREAIDYMQQGMDFARAFNQEFMQATFLMNLSKLYGSIYDYPQQMAFAKKALQQLEPDDKRILVVYSNLSDVYRSREQWDSAYVLDLKRLGHPKAGIRDKSRSKLWIGAYHLNKQNWDSARVYLSEALHSFQEIEDYRNLGVCLSFLGKLEMGKGRPDRALSYFDRADKEYGRLSQLDLSDEQYANAQRKVRALVRLGREKEAEAALIEMIQFRDSAYRLELSREVEELNVRYQTRIQADSMMLISAENEVLALENEQKALEVQSKRNWILALLFGLGLLIALLFELRQRLVRQQRNNRLLKISLEEWQEKAEAQPRELLEGTYLINNKDKRRVQYQDILFIKSADKAVVFHLRSGEEEWAWQSLKQTLGELPDTLFLRVHKSYIVNFSQIKSVNGSRLVLKNGVEISIGGVFRDQLLQRWSE